MRRLAGCVILTTLVAGQLAACSGEPKVPAPDLSKFLHANYSVTGQQKIGLVPGEPDAIVVESTGPGPTKEKPVSGGTQNVQVLAFDTQAKRWVVVFDASDQISVEQVATGMPLLDQTHPIERAHAQALRFAGADRPSLAIWGLDNSTNHPSFAIAVVSLTKGAATVKFAQTGTDPDNLGLDVPRVSGDPKAQVLKLVADFVPAGTPACCAVRTYTRTVSMNGQSVQVTADDRPYFGVYATPDLTTAGATVLRVDPGSPASKKIRVGDVIVGVDQEAAAEDDDTGSSAPIVDALAKHHAGDVVDFRVKRGAITATLPVRPSSVLDPGFLAAEPENGHLGVTVDDSDFTILDGTQESPLLPAGLSAGDRLLSVNGRAIRESDDLAIALWGTGGQSVPIAYEDSEGVDHTVNITPLVGGASDTQPLAVDHV